MDVPLWDLLSLGPGLLSIVVTILVAGFRAHLQHASLVYFLENN